MSREFTTNRWGRLRQSFLLVFSTSLVILLIGQGGAARAAVVTDNFNTTQDYKTNGVTGTIWDGILNSGVASVANANTTNAGNLTVTSANGSWENTGDSGFLLYRNVTGDFTAIVQVVSAPYVSYNTAGLMARNSAGSGSTENWIADQVIGAFSIGPSQRNTVNGTSTTTGVGTSLTSDYLKLVRSGNSFSTWYSADGTTYTQMGSTVVRADLPSTLQIGLFQATFSANSGTAQFDNFSLNFTSTATWNGTTDAQWSTATNWSPSVTPGTGYTVTFNNAGSGNTTVNLGSGVTATSLTFDTASAAAYTIGSGSVGSQTLTLDPSGAITVNSTGTNSQTVNANITLGSAAGASAYAFTNDSTTGGQLLTIAGAVRSATTGAKTLSVGGAGNTLISGNISDGSAGTVALTKMGNGMLTLAGSNSYSGATNVNGGTLAIAAGSALSSGITTVGNSAVLLLASGGALGSGATTINSGGLLDVSAYGSGGYTLGSGTLTAGRSSGTPATDVNGTLNLQHATLNVADLSTAGTLTITAGSLNLSSGTMAYDPGDLIALGSGGLTLSGGTTYVNPYTQLTSGSTYTLFTYASESGEPSTYLKVGGQNASARQTYTFAAGPTSLTLTVTGNPATLTWTGSNNSGAWDTQVTANWSNSGSSDVFYALDNVIFSDSAGTTNGSVVVSGIVQPTSLTVSNTNVNYTFSGTGTIAGVGSLSKSGPAALLISTSNSYSGGTTLNQGTLTVGNDAALGSGTLTLAGGTLQADSAAHSLVNAVSVTGDFAIGGSQNLTLAGSINLNNASRAITVNNSGATTFAGAISNLNGGFLRKNGPGTLTLTGSSNLTGHFYLNQGSVVIAGSGSVTANGAWQDIGSEQAGTVTLTVKDNGKFSSDNDLNLPEGSASAIVNIQDNGSMTGNNVFIGKGASGTSGTVNVTGGSFTANGQTSLGLFAGTGGVLNVSGGTFTSAGLLGVGNEYYSNANAGTGLVNQTAGLVNANGGVQIGNQGATYSAASGIYQLSGGTLVTNALTRGRATTTLFNFNGGTFRAGGSFAIDSALPTMVQNGGAIFDTNNNTLTIPGTLAEDPASTGGGLTKTGGGTLVLSGTNTYSGATSVNGGVLNFAGLYNLGAGTAINFGGGTLHWAAGSTTDISTRAVTLGAGGGTFDTGTNNVTLANPIGNNGSGGLTKTGAGTLVLTVSNTYTGGTTLNQGTLAVGNDAALGSGTLTIGGGTLQAAGGPHSIANAVTVTGDFTIGGTQDLTLRGNVGLGAGRRLTVTNTGNTTFSGAVALTSGIFYKDGPGTLTLTGTTTLPTQLYLDRGTIVLSGTGSLTGNGSYNDVGGNDAQGIQAGETVTMTVKDSAAFHANDLNVNEGSGGTGVLNVQDSGAVTSNNTWVGKGGATTVGSVYQTGGSFTINGYCDLGAGGGQGNYNLSAGTLTVKGAGGLRIGYRTWDGSQNAGAGTVTQTGGLLDATTIVLGTQGTAKTGSGTYNLNGGTLLTGGIAKGPSAASTVALNFDGGTLKAKGGLTLAADVPTTINGGGATIDTNGQTVTFNTPLLGGTGSGGLTKTGNGTLVLNGTDTYTGPTAVNVGVLKLGTVGAMPTGTSLALTGTLDLNNYDATVGVVSGAGTVDKSSAATPVNNLSVSSGTFSGTIKNTTGTIALVKSTGGTLTLSGTNTYTGGTTINAGVLAFGQGALGSTGNVTFGGGTLLYYGGNTEDISARIAPLAGHDAKIDTAGSDVMFSAAVTGTGSLTKLGSGVLTLAGTNTYSGDTTVADAGSVLTVSNTGNLGGGNIFLDSGALRTTGADAFNTAKTVTLNSSSAIDAQNSAGTTLAGNVTEYVEGGPHAALTKTGSGLLTLSGSNDYMGGTVVNAGTLNIATADSLPTDGSLTIASGGHVALAGGLSHAISLGGLTITSGAGASFGAGLPTPPASGAWSGDPAPTALVASPAAPTPEPSTIALLAAAVLAGLTVWRRKRM